MIVVADASPLITLAAVDQLRLLQPLYTEVLVPPTVHREATGPTPIAPGAQQVRRADWIRVQEVNDTLLIDALRVELDLGEAEAIALAVQISASVLLMDERRGRAAAQRLGCRVVGVLGVLIEAKQRQQISAVRPILDAMRTQAGFRVSEELHARVLDAAGE